jgi:uncharacterized membrane protein YkoI
MAEIIRVLTLGCSVGMVALSPTAATAEINRCIDDWSEAAPIMLQQGLVGTKELHEQARQHLTGAVLRITLCQDGERYVYRLLMRGANGRLNLLTLDARNPFAH